MNAGQPALSRPRRNGNLFDALAEVGVTEDDYLAVQKARRIIDAVNARLAARGATVVYAVTCNPVGPVPGHVVSVADPFAEFTEAATGRGTPGTTNC